LDRGNQELDTPDSSDPEGTLTFNAPDLALTGPRIQAKPLPNAMTGPCTRPRQATPRSPSGADPIAGASAVGGHRRGGVPRQWAGRTRRCPHPAAVARRRTPADRFATARTDARPGAWLQREHRQRLARCRPSRRPRALALPPAMTRPAHEPRGGPRQAPCQSPSMLDSTHAQHLADPAPTGHAAAAGGAHHAPKGGSAATVSTRRSPSSVDRLSA